jgi:hypothetical protein
MKMFEKFVFEWLKASPGSLVAISALFFTIFQLVTGALKNDASAKKVMEFFKFSQASNSYKLLVWSVIGWTDTLLLSRKSMHLHPSRRPLADAATFDRMWVYCLVYASFIAIFQWTFFDSDAFLGEFIIFSGGDSLKVRILVGLLIIMLSIVYFTSSPKKSVITMVVLFVTSLILGSVVAFLSGVSRGGVVVSYAAAVLVTGSLLSMLKDKVPTGIGFLCVMTALLLDVPGTKEGYTNLGYQLYAHSTFQYELSAFYESMIGHTFNFHYPFMNMIDFLDTVVISIALIAVLLTIRMLSTINTTYGFALIALLSVWVFQFSSPGFGIGYIGLTAFLFPLANYPLDVASVVVTRWAIRKGIRRVGCQTVFWSMIDALFAVILFVILAVIFVSLLKLSMCSVYGAAETIYGPSQGELIVRTDAGIEYISRQKCVNLFATNEIVLFTGIREHLTENAWLLAGLSTTLVPTFIHYCLAMASIGAFFYPKKLKRKLIGLIERSEESYFSSLAARSIISGVSTVAIVAPIFLFIVVVGFVSTQYLTIINVLVDTVEWISLAVLF